MNFYTKEEWLRIIEAGKHSDWGMERAIKESLPLLESWILKKGLHPVSDWISDLQISIPEAVHNFEGRCAWPWFLQEHLFRRANRFLRKKSRIKRGGHLERVGLEEGLAAIENASCSTTPCVADDIAYLMTPLNFKQRIAIELRYYHDMPYWKIGQICGCTMQNISARIKASLQKMRLHEERALARERALF